MNTNTVTLPNGEIITKQSKRNYTHAVAVLSVRGTWVVMSYASSEQNAQRSISALNVGTYLMAPLLFAGEVA